MSDMVVGKQWVVPMLESERGWGMKVDGYAGPFSSLSDAQQFSNSFNLKNCSENAVPDYYIKALEPVAYTGQNCLYRSTVEDPPTSEQIIEALEAENRDLRVDIEIKRKRLEDAEEMLKTVLDREAASITRHDAHIEALEAKLARVGDALGQAEEALEQIIDDMREGLSVCKATKNEAALALDTAHNALAAREAR